MHNGKTLYIQAIVQTYANMALVFRAFHRATRSSFLIDQRLRELHGYRFPVKNILRRVTRRKHS